METLEDEVMEDIYKMLLRRQQNLKTERELKIEEYQNFITHVFEPDLNKHLSSQEVLFKEMADYLELKNSLEKIAATEKLSLETLVNLGNEFFVPATIPNLNDLFVDIGMGIHVQFRLHEAIRWLQMKENHMDRLLQSKENEISDIKSRIVLITKALHDLIELNENIRMSD